MLNKGEKTPFRKIVNLAKLLESGEFLVIGNVNVH